VIPLEAWVIPLETRVIPLETRVIPLGRGAFPWRDGEENDDNNDILYQGIMKYNGSNWYRYRSLHNMLWPYWKYAVLQNLSN
jgi:hypothetical protein